jgi:hypothetical protein
MINGQRYVSQSNGTRPGSLSDRVHLDGPPHVNYCHWLPRVSPGGVRAGVSILDL